MNKRILFVALTVLMLITAFLTVSASANSIGDVDGDGSITAADARLALRASVKLETLTDAQTKAADVDGQPGITAADARLILRASVKLEELKDPHTHSFTGKVTKAATCTAEGVKTFTCECGEDTYTEKIPATGHSYDKGVVTLPTCTAEGYTTYTCSSCKHSYNADTVKANGHTEVKDKAVAATCTKTGLTEGKHCSVCGTVFTAQSVVPATGHNMKETAKAVAATCTTNGKTAVFTCSNNCGTTTGGTVVYAEGHKFSTTVNATEATCETNGNEAYKSCTVCNKFFAAAEDKMSENTKENADAFTTPKNKNNHADLKTVTAKTPTCTEDGYKAYEYCTECDYTTYEKDEAKGHSFSATVNATDATCATNGNEAYKSCTVCNKFFAASADNMSTDAKANADAFATPKNKNNHADLKTVTAKTPTCTEDGYKAYEYCTKCDYTTYEKDEAKGHSFSAITEAKAATCIATGNKAYKSCTVCNKFFAEAEDKMSENAKDSADAFTTAIDSTNHAAVLTQVEAQAPTCTEIGWYAYEYCSECDYTTYEEIPELGHSTTEEGDKEPTCTEPGYCTRCETELPAIATGHDLVSKTVNHTCFDDGYTVDICTRCDYYENLQTPDNLKAPGHHSFDEENIKVVAATCTTQGYKEKTCTASYWLENEEGVLELMPCGVKEKFDIVDELGHSLLWETNEEASCTKTGLKTGTCTRDNCNYTTTEIIPLKAHSPSATAITVPGEGDTYCKLVIECTVCHTALQEDSTQGHRIEFEYDYVADDEICTTDATGTKRCMVCNYVEENVLIAKATGHEGNISDYTPATCTKDGYAVIGHCTTCNKEINGGFVIPATGHTTSGIATCTTDVRCMICNEVVEEKLGHNFKVRALAYNTDIDQFFCTRCGVATEDTLDTFNALANSIKGTYFRDHFNNPKNGSNRIELIRFSKTTANTTYSRFDFGIYTNTIKDLYDDEMAKNTDNYSPVRTTGILRNTLPLTNTGVVSLLEAGDIDASNGIKAEKLNSLNVRDVLSAYSDTYTVGEKNYDISSYKKVINEEVIKVTVNVKNEKYSQIKNLPDNQSTALEKVFDLNIRDDVKEFKDVNGRLILEEQDKGDGYEITMSMELLEIESDATVTYYFAADTYEPILAVYNAKIIMDQTIDMNFKIGLFSLNGEIDPVITTNYSYAYLFPNFFA